MENNANKNSNKNNVLPAILASVLALILALIIIFIVGFLIYNKKPEVVVEETTIQKETEPIKVEEPVVDKSITLAFCGDSMLHIPQVLDAYDDTNKKYDFNSTFKYVRNDIMEADYAITNFETVLAGTNPSGFPRFSAPDEWAFALKDAGFDMFVNANNHALDQKIDGLKRTIDVLDNMSIDHIGTYKTREDYEKTNGTFIKNINGYNVGFMALSKGSNGFSVPKDNPYALNVYTKDYHDSVFQKDVDYEKIDKEIEYLKNQNVDVIVAMMHWGLENYKEPAPQQIKLANYLTEHSVNIVIGTHPNVQEKFEYDYQKNNIVVYSLGNFISSMTDEYNTSSGIFYIKLDRNEAKKVVIKDAYYKPITTIIRDRGLTPRFFAMNTQKTLENIVTKSDKELLSYMTHDIIEKLYNSLNITYKVWEKSFDKYVKDNSVNYNYDSLITKEVENILKNNEIKNRLAPKKKNWSK